MGGIQIARGLVGQDHLRAHDGGAGDGGTLALASISADPAVVPGDTRSYTALTVAINASLALKLSHEIENNTNPPDESDAKTDTTTAASILYSF